MSFASVAGMWVGLASPFGLLAHPPELPGTEVKPQLYWDAPNDCPGVQEAEVEFQQRLLEVEGSVPWAIARVRRNEDGTYNLKIWVEQGGTLLERTLDAESCASLARVTATIIALTLASARSNEPDSTDGVAPSSRDLAREIEAELDIDRVIPALAWPESDNAEPLEPGPRELGGGLRLEGFVGIGGLQGVEWGAALSPSVIWRRARLEFRALYASCRSFEYSQVPGSQFKLRLIAGDVRGCGVPRVGRFEFPLCAGVEVGALLGQQEGFQLLHGPAQPWLVFPLSGGVNFRVIPVLAFVLTTETWIAAQLPSFRALDGVVDAGGRVGLRVWLGVELRFNAETKLIFSRG